MIFLDLYMLPVKVISFSFNVWCYYKNTIKIMSVLLSQYKCMIKQISYVAN